MQTGASGFNGLRITPLVRAPSDLCFVLLPPFYSCAASGTSPIAGRKELDGALKSESH